MLAASIEGSLANYGLQGRLASAAIFRAALWVLKRADSRTKMAACMSAEDSGTPRRYASLRARAASSPRGALGSEAQGTTSCLQEEE